MFGKKEDVVKTVEELEKELSAICQKIYDLNIGGRNVKLINKWVLVRVLPKEHKTEGGIWLAETSQNKPIYESIVIKVWEPYEEEFKVSATSTYNEVLGEQRYFYKTVTHKSSYKAGDRVIFQHFVGLPLADYLDDRYYRIVKESDILMPIDYSGDANVSAQIRSLTKSISSITTSGASIARGSDR